MCPGISHLRSGHFSKVGSENDTESWISVLATVSAQKGNSQCQQSANYTLSPSTKSGALRPPSWAPSSACKRWCATACGGRATRTWLFKQKPGTASRCWEVFLCEVRRIDQTGKQVWSPIVRPRKDLLRCSWGRSTLFSYITQFNWS